MNAFEHAYICKQIQKGLRGNKSNLKARKYAKNFLKDSKAMHEDFIIEVLQTNENLKGCKSFEKFFIDWLQLECKIIGREFEGLPEQGKRAEWLDEFNKKRNAYYTTKLIVGG